MELHFFKEPFRDRQHPELVRLLFEAEKSAGLAEGYSDFYMYIWIDSRTIVDGFQAILDEEFAMTFKAPAQIEFGAITTQSIGRTIRESKSMVKRKKMLRLLDGSRCEYFPDLLGMVGAIARGEVDVNRTLDGKEARYLKKLMKGR
jgi:hypothetical protein